MRIGYCGGDLRIFCGVWRSDGILEGMYYFSNFAENEMCDRSMSDWIVIVDVVD